MDKIRKVINESGPVGVTEFTCFR